jgi:tripartite-type tricarboxylate transporter receptor subunit TctC
MLRRGTLFDRPETGAGMSFIRALAMAVAAMIGGSMGALAQSWPSSQTVRIVVPFPPGGANDVIARLLAEDFQKTFGGSFIVENVTGAGGNLGTDRVAKAAPDGYTLVLSSSGPLANNRLLYKNLPYNPEDLTPVALVAKFPMVLAARNTLGAATLKDLVALGKSKPGVLNVGSPGVGTMGHLTAELFQSRAGIKLQHIPSRDGYAKSIAALLSGDLDLMSDVMNGNIIEMIKSNRIRGLAVTTRQRFAGLPDTPTAIEQGVDLDAATAFALAGPARMPQPIVEKLNKEANRYLTSADGVARLVALGAEAGVAGGPPSDVSEMMAASIKQWKPIIDAAGLSF